MFQYLNKMCFFFIICCFFHYQIPWFNTGKRWKTISEREFQWNASFSIPTGNYLQNVNSTRDLAWSILHSKNRDTSIEGRNFTRRNLTELLKVKFLRTLLFYLHGDMRLETKKNWLIIETQKIFNFWRFYKCQNFQFREYYYFKVISGKFLITEHILLEYY